MLKKILSLVIVSVAFLALPVNANASTTVCTQEYGQPVVCKEVEEQVLAVTHEPVATGLADVSLGVVGAGLLIASGLLLVLSKRKASASIFVK